MVTREDQDLEPGALAAEVDRTRRVWVSGSLAAKPSMWPIHVVPMKRPGAAV